MRSLVATALLATGLVLSGCAADATDPSDEDPTGESTDALSAYGQSLVGAYKLASGTGDFTWIVLESNGRYFTETQIYCITTPCVNPRESGRFVGYKPYGGATAGGLRLYPAGGGRSHYYRVVPAKDGASIKLSTDGARTFSRYDSVGTFCDTAADCLGQSYIHILCVGYMTCASNKCGYACGIARPVDECKTDADCHLADDYCTGCDCRALSSTETLPACSGPGVRCFAQPCMGKKAACVSGQCTTATK